MGKYILIKLGSYIIFYCQAYLRYKLNFFNQIMIRQKTLLKLSSYVASISRHYFGKAWIIWNNSNFSCLLKKIHLLASRLYQNVAQQNLNIYQKNSRKKHTFYQFLFCYWTRHCVKSVQIRSYFWSVFSCIRTEYRKMRTRNNSVFGHFSCSVTKRKLGEEDWNFLHLYNIPL